MAPKPEDLIGTQPDGAKPGDVVTTPNDKYGFDADGRAAERESADVTIGGIVFRRRRKTWEVTRELRRILRLQEKAGNRAERARKKIDALPADAEDHELDALEDEVDKHSDEADEQAYALIALLLEVDREQLGDRQSDVDEQGRPTVDHLKRSLDVSDAGDLAASLAGGSNEQDPTPATPSS